MKKSRAVYVPFLIWVFMFVLIPLGLVIYYSLTNKGGNFTLANFRELTDPVYLSYLLRSLKLAVLATVLCFIIGYPTALVLAGDFFKNKLVWLVLVIAPMWMNLLLRTYAWQVILEDTGIINTFMRFLGFEGLRIRNTEGAVLLGMVYDLLPFMIFPIYTSVSKIPGNMLEAAADLGANRFTTLRKIIFPLSIPGIISGVTMVFVPGVTNFVISQYLGGGECNLIGDIIQEQFTTMNNWNLGSALSVVVMVIILVCMRFVNNTPDDDGRGVVGL